MRQLRKVGLLCLTICMLACLAVGAIFTMSYAELVKTGYGNVQLYTENDVKFEDRLWDVDYYASHKAEWKITSGPYTTAYDENTNPLGYYMGNHANKGITVEAYLIDGTYYYGDTTGGVNTITKVFAWVGFPNPTTHPEPEEGYPAVVCIHGGGGSAYSEWVAEWANLGYVAIAMDTEGMLPTTHTYDYTGPNQSTGTVEYKLGQIDGSGKPISTLRTLGTDEADAILNSKLGDGTTINDHVFAKQNAWFKDTLYGTDLKTHWFYQATAAVIASNTFIRTFDNVNPEHVGVTGISYGSYLTSLAIGYDSRFAAAVPIYGSLNQQIGDKYFAQSTQPTDSRNSVAGGIWDNPVILSGVTTPTLYLMGNMDNHFDVRSTWSCAKLQTNAKVIIRDEYPHGHTFGAKYSDTAQYVKSYNADETPNYYKDTPAGYLKDVVDFFNVHLKNDETISQITINSQIFKQTGTDHYIFDVKVPSGTTITQANIYYATNSLLINDGTYLNGGAGSYGHYAMGDLSYNNGVAAFDWNQKYINTTWTKIALTAPVADTTNHYYYNYFTDALGNNVWRTQFIEPGGAYNLFANTPTYFYVEVKDSNGHYLVSDIVDLDPNEKPLYGTRLFDYYAHENEGKIVEFDWSADANGWAIENRALMYDRAYGPLNIAADSTSVPKDANNKANNIVLGHHITDAEIASGQSSNTGYLNHYGARAQGYANGVSSIWTDGASIMNYRPFNIYNDIEFYFNVSSEHSYTMVTNKTTGEEVVYNTVDDADYLASIANDSNYDIQEVGGHCYFFTLFDNIETALKCGNEVFRSATENPYAPKLFVAGSNCAIEDENNIYRQPLQGTLAINKATLMSDSVLAEKYRSVGATYNENQYLQSLVNNWSDADIKAALKTNNPTTYTDEVLNNMDHEALVKALIPDAEQLWFTTKSAFQETTTSNWADNWHKVTIRILDSGTFVYLNGNPIIDPLTGEAYCHDLTREDFKNGFAYLGFANSGNMQVNFRYEDLSFENQYGTKFDFSKKDANGFSTYVQNSGTAYYLNGVLDSSIDIGKDFGSVENHYSGGVSTFKFNDNIVTNNSNNATNGSVIRYTPFDINEDIQFSYNFSAPIEFVSGVQTNNFHYFFGLYDSLQNAFVSAGDNTKAQIALLGSNFNGNDRDGNSRSIYNGKVALKSGELTNFWSTTQSDIDNRVSWNLYPHYTDPVTKTSSQTINEINWDQHYINVKISIGETSTSIYLNGDLFVETASITKANFPNGYAYLKLYALVQNGDATVNVKLGDNQQDGYVTYETYRNIKNYNDFPIDEPFNNYNSTTQVYTKFTYPMNEFGWSTVKRSDNQLDYTDGKGNFINLYDSADSVSTQEDNGITTYDFVTADDAGRMAINFISFDIDEDIVFQFKVNDGASESEQVIGKTLFNFALFDSIGKAYQSRDVIYDVNPATNASAPVLALESVNGEGIVSNVLNGVTTYRNYYSRLKVCTGPYNFTLVNGDRIELDQTNANGESVSSGSYVTCSEPYNIGLGDNVEFNEVRIRILDSYTLIYLNGDLVGYFNDVTKASVPTGKVYLKLWVYNQAGWGASGTNRFALRTFAKNSITQKYDYAMDKYNGIATDIHDIDSYKNYTNIAGDNLTTQQFGLAPGSTFGVNKATLNFDRSYTVNYRGFDVTKDIVFKYTASTPTYGEDEDGFSAPGVAEGDTTLYNYSSYWYAFSFYDSAEIALKTGMELWRTANQEQSLGGHAKISLFGCNEPSGRVPAMDEGNNRSNYINNYGKLLFNNYAGSDSLVQTVAEGDPITHVVRIRILEDCTEYYLNGIYQFSNDYVKRSDFTYGKAYMAIGVCGIGTIDLEIDREVELYTYPTGNVYDYAVDENGWTTFKNPTENILAQTLPVLYNADLDAYRYTFDEEYRTLVNSSPREYGITGNHYFSRNNGAEINAKGQSVINLGLAQQDGNGNEITDKMSMSTYVVKTTGFDVYRPIRIIYRLDSFAETGGTVSDASCIMFTLTETLDDAFEVKNEGYDQSSGLGKIMLRTTNSLWFNEGSDSVLGDAKFAGKILGYDTTKSSEFLYDNVTLEDYCKADSDFASWQKDITVDINIGDTGTVISINGKEVDLGYSNVKRSDFEYGRAYLNLCGFGGVNVAVKTSQGSVNTEGETEMLIGDKFSLINTFELPIGYYDPQVSYAINGVYAITDFAIDGGVVNFDVDKVSPHHAGRTITVEYSGIIDGERKVISTKEFVLKTYLENALADVNATITALTETNATDTRAYTIAIAKRELIVSYMNLSAAYQNYYASVGKGNGVSDGFENLANATLDEETYGTIDSKYSALGTITVENKMSNSHVEGTLVRIAERNVGIGSRSTSYYLTFRLNTEADINNLKIVYSFNGNEVQTFTKEDFGDPVKANEVNADGETYNQYEIAVGEINPLHYDKEIKFEYKYNDTSYGYHSTSVLDYAVGKVGSSDAVVKATGKALYLFWHSVNAYYEAING